MAPSVTIPAESFYVDRATDATHNNACEAIYAILRMMISPLVEVDNEIADALRLIITNTYHQSATGREFFRFRPGPEP